MRALGDADIGVDAHLDRDAAAIVRDVQHLADRHAREADLRLPLDADDLVEACVDRISFARFERKARESEHERDEQEQSYRRERADFRFCLHALASPFSFVVRSVWKNACTRGSWSC